MMTDKERLERARKEFPLARDGDEWSRARFFDEYADWLLEMAELSITQDLKGASTEAKPEGEQA